MYVASTIGRGGGELQEKGARQEGEMEENIGPQCFIGHDPATQHLTLEVPPPLRREALHDTPCQIREPQATVGQAAKALHSLISKTHKHISFFFHKWVSGKH